MTAPSTMLIALADQLQAELAAMPQHPINRFIALMPDVETAVDLFCSLEDSIAESISVLLDTFHDHDGAGTIRRAVVSNQDVRQMRVILFTALFEKRST